MNIIEIPLGLSSKLYRGHMPGYEKRGGCDKAATDLKMRNIATIVLLCDDRECEHWTHTNLRKFYINQGFDVIQFPIPDYGMPNREKLKTLVLQVAETLKTPNNNTLVHCLAGHGRTGMVLACIARQTNNMQGNEAIRLVKSYVDGAIKYDPHQEIVRHFLEETPSGISNIHTSSIHTSSSYSISSKQKSRPAIPIITAQAVESCYPQIKQSDSSSKWRPAEYGDAKESGTYLHTRNKKDQNEMQRLPPHSATGNSPLPRPIAAPHVTAGKEKKAKSKSLIRKIVSFIK